MSQNVDEEEQKIRKRGWLNCEAKIKFMYFNKITLFFTPKTLLIYKIEASRYNKEEDVIIIKSAFEKKYKEEMKEEKDRLNYKFILSEEDRIIRVIRSRRAKAAVTSIILIDEKLSKLNNKERMEFLQEQANTTGL